MNKTPNMEDLKKQFLENVQNAKEPVCPDIFNDERLEDAFKIPKYDKKGFAESIPAIWDDYCFTSCADSVKVLSASSSIIESNLYSKYLDVEALV